MDAPLPTKYPQAPIRPLTIRISIIGNRSGLVSSFMVLLIVSSHCHFVGCIRDGDQDRAANKAGEGGLLSLVQSDIVQTA